MTKLIDAITRLAEAAAEYLERKNHPETMVQPGLPMWSEPKLAASQVAAQPSVGPLVPPPPPPGPIEPEKVKRVRRTKEQIAADAVVPAPVPVPAPVDPFGATTAPAPVAGVNKTDENPLGGKIQLENGTAKQAEKVPAPVMSEVESKDKLMATMAGFIQLCKNMNPDGQVRAKEAFVKTFNVAKIKDLTHAQRIEGIALFEKMSAEVGAGVGAGK